MNLKLIQDLLEVADNSQARLTDTQKTVLVTIYASPTPETAYDSVTGKQNLVTARTQLRNMNLVVVDDTNSRAGITDDGFQALSNNNLIDDTGDLTEEGKSLVIQDNSITETVHSNILKTLI